MNSTGKDVLARVAFLSIGLLLSCSNQETIDAKLIEQAKTDIVKTEEAFEQYVTENGDKEGYLAFADPNAALSRDGNIYSGKSEIARYFDERESEVISLKWKTDFVEVSASGDLGYTYGKYKGIGKDSVGNQFEWDGIFHTVWKKQEDGSWKLVFD